MNALNALRNNFAINGGFFAFSGFAAGPSLGCGGPQGPMDSNSTCFAPEQCSGNALPNLMAAWGGGGADAIGQRGGRGNDLQRASGGFGHDRISQGGGKGNDRMVANGGFGNDVIRQFGGKGNDVSVANGGFGNDRFELGVVKGNNRASLNGGAGYDSATIRAGKNVTVVGADGEVIFQRGNGGSVVRVNSIEDLQVVGKGGKTLYDSTPDPVC